MKRTLVRDLSGQMDQQVTVQGYVHAIRDQKVVQFLVVRDHTGMVQVVIDRSADNQRLNEQVSALTKESTISLTGRLVANPRVRMGGMEILCTDLSIESIADPALPIDIFGRTETNLSKRLDWRFLDLRHPRNQLLLDVQTTAEYAMRGFWIDNGFVEIHSPKIMGSPS